MTSDERKTRLIVSNTTVTINKRLDQIDRHQTELSRYLQAIRLKIKTPK